MEARDQGKGSSCRTDGGEEAESRKDVVFVGGKQGRIFFCETVHVETDRGTRGPLHDEEGFVMSCFVIQDLALGIA